jgi:ribosome-binding protein aMBF1 (putative translation factor)
MITGTQIRSARAALRWSVQHLAEAAGVGTQTIKRFEVVDAIPQSRTQTLLDVKAALEAAGIEFIGTAEEGPGIRLWVGKARAP